MMQQLTFVAILFLLCSPQTSAGAETGIALADSGVFYATTGHMGPNPGSLITIEPSNGAGTLIGSTGITGAFGAAVPALAIKSTGEMYATSSDTSADLYRIDALTGAGTFVANIGLAYSDALAFDGNNILYAIDGDGNLYIVDDQTGATTFIGPTGVFIRGMEFDPTTGILWGGNGSTAPDDGVYTIDVTTGAATLVGNFGLNHNAPAILFDQTGNLYGAIGGGAEPNQLISIDKTTGAGTIIGDIGFLAVAGMSTRVNRTVLGVKPPIPGLPENFNLTQNYPNPFNPSTLIQYALPDQSAVSLKIYNLLGQEVATLVDDTRPAGFHAVRWNGTNQSGHTVASGLYFYRMEARSTSSTNAFTDLKKMLLVK